jgi:hypothetical protein
MVEVVIMTVFFVGLTVGSVIAALAGRLPTSTRLAQEDEARFDA